MRRAALEAAPLGFFSVASRVRSFVALEMPDRQRVVLAGHLEECARLAAGYRWVAPESLHLTLRFLGGLELPTLDGLRAELARARGAPFRLALGGLGTFGGSVSPRVVWLRVTEGLDACAALARGVEAACQAAGLEPEPRGFRAHVTLARQRTESERLPELPAPPPLDPWTVEHFVLYESILRPGGPRYVPLERYPLDGG